MSDDTDRKLADAIRASLLRPSSVPVLPVRVRPTREFPLDAFVTVQRFIGDEPVEITGYVDFIDEDYVTITKVPGGEGWSIMYDRRDVSVHAGGAR